MNVKKKNFMCIRLPSAEEILPLLNDDDDDDDYDDDAKKQSVINCPSPVIPPPFAANLGKICILPVKCSVYVT